METRTNLKQVIAASLIAATTLVIVTPTVAQGDGAKSAYLADLKRLGEVFSLYAADFDDRLPLAMPRRETGAWAAGTYIPSPANVLSNSPWNNPVRHAWSQTIWRNSTTVYSPFPNTELPGGDSRTLAGDTFAGTPNVTNPTMNGLLHAYPTTAIGSPANVPMIWLGQGRANLVGRAFSNPALNCATAPDCQFNASGPPSSMTFGSGSNTYVPFFGEPFWIYGGHTPMVFADGSVRLIAVGTKIDPEFVTFENAYTDPFAQVSANGSPNTFWTCAGNGTPSPSENAYHCFFRPDRTSSRPGKRDYNPQD